MRSSGPYINAFLTLWLVLFAPVVTGLHHHAVPSAGVKTLSHDPGTGSRTADFPSCEICFRLGTPGEITPAVDMISLLMNDGTGFICNEIPLLFHPIPNIDGRGPPLSCA